MKEKPYPILVVGLILAFLAFSGWSARQAITKGAQITDRDYYSKGLRYNATLVEKRAASVLGWRLESSLRHGRLQIRLADAQGLQVAGAQGRLTFFHHTDRQQTSLSLDETLPGTYQATLPNTLQGEVTVRVAFEHNGARINRQLLLSI